MTGVGDHMLGKLGVFLRDVSLACANLFDDERERASVQSREDDRRDLILSKFIEIGIPLIKGIVDGMAGAPPPVGGLGGFGGFGGGYGGHVCGPRHRQHVRRVSPVDGAPFGAPFDGFPFANNGAMDAAAEAFARADGDRRARESTGVGRVRDQLPIVSRQDPDDPREVPHGGIIYGAAVGREVKVKPGLPYLAIARHRSVAFRGDRITINGDASRWNVHDIKVGGRSQFVHAGGAMPGDVFAKTQGGGGAAITLETAQTAMDIGMLVEYVGPELDGEVFDCTIDGDVAI